MKKRLALFLAVFSIALLKLDVYACGEIKELTSSSGTVTMVDDSNYLITVPDDISAVTLYGTTDYTWVTGFEPRKVSTSEVSELKVDGNACGYGIYTYFVRFKKKSSIIAENTPNQNDDETPPADNKPDNSDEENQGNAGSNLLLKSLTVEGYDLNFDPYTYEYSLEVGLDVVYLSIKATPETQGVSVSISENAFSLIEGENLVAVTLVDANGNTAVYNIKVNKVPPKSNNNYLSSLKIEDYQFNFDPAKNVYELEIGKDLSLNISAVTQDTKSTYEIIGNVNLHTGSVITIKVTAEDGSVRDYVINIKRVFNIMDYWIYIVIALLLLLLGILLIISKKKKNKKKLGPQTIDGQQETAGVVQEITSQNVAPIEPQNGEENVSVMADVQAGTLKIIEPTDIEKTDDSSNKVDEENSPTEIFEL